jgi:HlyD family secretion protein
VPNAALRFYPEKAWVHPDDQKILAGIEEESNLNFEGIKQSAEDRNDSEIKRRKRHVWFPDGPLLRAKLVTIGVSDSRFSELISGDLSDGQNLVTAKETLPVAK